MEAGLILKIAGIGILVASAHQILSDTSTVKTAVVK
jgi:hypothetical protein